MKITLGHSDIKHIRGQWVVVFTFAVGTKRVWRYRRYDNAVVRFLKLRENHPNHPFEIAGFKSEPDPIAPKIGLLGTMLISPRM